MSKIAKKIIDLQDIKHEYKENILILKYNNKSVQLKINSKVRLHIKDNKITTTSNKDDLSLCGTVNRNINNLILGLKNPFVKHIKLEGTGYKGALDGNQIIFNLGYSHTIKVDIPEDVNIKFQNPTQIEISSISKQSTGNFAQKLTEYRPHNPYSGKGVLRLDKTYIRKETKRK